MSIDRPNLARGWSIRLRGEASSIPTARDFVRDTASELPISDDGLRRLALLVSELTTNAVQASPGGTVLIEVAGDEEAVTVSVINRAANAALPDRSEWDADRGIDRSGRGLGIVDQVASEVTVEVDGDLVKVTAVVPI